MSPIEELREWIIAQIEVHSALHNYKSRDARKAQLSALDALIAERDALKARLEKAEAELEQANVVLRYATKTKDQYHSERDALEQERDALRKALEPFSDLLDGLDNEHDNAPIEIEVSIMERGVFTVGDLRRAHAALHGTAKQEPKHRTCGECAGQAACMKDSICWVFCSDNCPACEDFHPRADAQKGQV